MRVQQIALRRSLVGAFPWFEVLILSVLSKALGPVKRQILKERQPSNFDGDAPTRNS